MDIFPAFLPQRNPKYYSKETQRNEKITHIISYCKLMVNLSFNKVNVNYKVKGITKCRHEKNYYK